MIVDNLLLIIITIIRKHNLLLILLLIILYPVPIFWSQILYSTILKKKKSVDNTHI